MLGTTQPNVGLRHCPAYRFIRNPDAGLFGQHVCEALVGPERKRQIQTPWALAHEVEQPFLVGAGEFRCGSESRSIRQASNAFGLIALTPPPDSFLSGADNGGNLGSNQPLFRS